MSTSSCATDLGSLVGLDHAKDAVRGVLSSDSGVHAVLFYGPEGAGKARLARTLAKSWMCPQPVEGGLACGECAVCRAFDSGRSADFVHVPPWGPQSLIKASALYEVPGWSEDKDRPQIPFVLEFFRTRPLMARAKVVLFEQVDRMNPAAANAFLKTLEEPGPGSKIVMTTDEFTQVLPTIRSRCMCVACELPEAGSGALGELTPIESVFGGSPGGVALVRQHPELFARLYDVLDRTRSEPLGAAFKLAEECRGVAEDFAKATGDNARAANVKVLECVAAWLAANRPERPELLAAAAEAHRRVLGNVGAPIAFENLFLDLLYHG